MRLTLASLHGWWLSQTFQQQILSVKLSLRSSQQSSLHPSHTSDNCYRDITCIRPSPSLFLITPVAPSIVFKTLEATPDQICPRLWNLSFSLQVQSPKQRLGDHVQLHVPPESRKRIWEATHHRSLRSKGSRTGNHGKSRRILVGLSQRSEERDGSGIQVAPFSGPLK